MTSPQLVQERGRHLRPSRRRDGRHLLLPVVVLAALACGAFGYIGYVLWPTSPGSQADAPPLPITVAGVAFNLPPAAIRVATQRRPGVQARVDLVFLWPSLEPPNANAKEPAPPPDAEVAAARTFMRVFMSITAAGDTLAPADRALTIYPRYTAAQPQPGANGLAVLAFRDGTPYDGEDLIYDVEASAFLVRCTRNGAGHLPGTCLNERRIGGADILVRFPRDWLSDWRVVADTLERLIASVLASR
jgi:hypothetical protein